MTPTVIRPPLWQRVVCTVALVLLVPTLVIGGAEDPAHRILAWLGAVGTGVVLLRSWFVRIEVWPEELVLVNWVSKRRVPWTEVRRIRYDLQLLVEIRDGREWGSAAFPYVPGAFEFAREPGRRAAARLQSIRSRRRGRSTLPAIPSCAVHVESDYWSARALEWFRAMPPEIVDKAAVEVLMQARWAAQATRHGAKRIFKSWR